MTWNLSPSGWPTWADPGSDMEFDLADRGYTVIDESDVQAAIDAFHAGLPPVLDDVVTVQELQSPSSPASVALRAASVAAVRESNEFASIAGMSGAIPAPIAKRTTWITQFQTGHGWTVGGTGGSTFNANDTSDPMFGSQSVTSVAVLGGVVNVDNTAVGPLDLTNDSLVIGVKIGPESPSGAISVNAYTDSSNFFNWQPSGDYFADGWRFYECLFGGVRTTTGAPNRANITRIRVQFLNTQPGFHAVGGIGRRSKHPDYPNGAMMIWEDDGYASVEILRAETDKRGQVATIAAIGDLVDTAGKVTLGRLRHLQDVSGWDVVCHAFTSAAHAARFTSMTDDQVVAELRGIQRWLQERGFRGWRHLATPGGQYDNRVGRLIRDAGFLSNRTSSTYLIETMVSQRPVPLDPLNLRNIAVNSSNAASVLPAIQAAHDDAAVASISFHDIDASGAATTAQVRTILDLFVSLNMPTVTPTMLLGA